MSGGKIQIMSAAETDEVQDGLAMALGAAMQELDAVTEQIKTLVTALCERRDITLLVE